MSDSDTWSQLQAHKRQQENLRERLAKRRKERRVLLDQTLTSTTAQNTTEISDTKQEEEVTTENTTQTTTPSMKKRVKTTEKAPDEKIVDDIEKLLSRLLGEKQTKLPASSEDIQIEMEKELKLKIDHVKILMVLDKLEAQNLVSLKKRSGVTFVLDCEYTKLKAVHGNNTEGKKSDDEKTVKDRSDANVSRNYKKSETEEKDDIATLLSMPTTKEVENKQLGSEILDLLNQPTAKELSLVQKFKSQGGATVREFCPYGTREECRRNHTEKGRCRKLHFRKIIQAHTDDFLGDCSFLNTCFHMDTCKYVHYEVDTRGTEENEFRKSESTAQQKSSELMNMKNITMTPPQWIQCDVRYLDFYVLGKFGVVMADPPWDIHMELPYGTMSDNEMKSLPISNLSDHGYIFLWVTGRAIELGRECLKIWGYHRCDELIWVKTNQLQRLIRTGRTGHWINHGKEHCIIGVKGKPDPALFNKGLDCDVLVSEVRDTSHKPDEIYGLIERLAPGQRKIEIFGRMHNVQPNWVTLGNQLSGVNIVEPEMVRRFQEKYPSGEISKSQSKPSLAGADVPPQQTTDGQT